MLFWLFACCVSRSCLASRDPYCGWTRGSTCSFLRPGTRWGQQTCTQYCECLLPPNEGDLIAKSVWAAQGIDLNGLSLCMYIHRLAWMNHQSITQLKLGDVTINTNWRENMQIPQKEAHSPDLNPRPPSCEASVLTAALTSKSGLSLLSKFVPIHMLIKEN